MVRVIRDILGCSGLPCKNGQSGKRNLTGGGRATLSGESPLVRVVRVIREIWGCSGPHCKSGKSGKRNLMGCIGLLSLPRSL